MPFLVLVWFGGALIVVGLLLVVYGLRATPPQIESQHPPVQPWRIGMAFLGLATASGGGGLVLLGNAFTPGGMSIHQAQAFILGLWGCTFMAYVGCSLAWVRMRLVMRSRQRQLAQQDRPYDV
jgi:hypothetical protein